MVKEIGIYWDDLTPAAQQKLLAAFGDNCNWDVFPITTLYIEEDN